MVRCSQTVWIKIDNILGIDCVGCTDKHAAPNQQKAESTSNDDDSENQSSGIRMSFLDIFLLGFFIVTNPAALKRPSLLSSLSRKP